MQNTVSKHKAYAMLTGTSIMWGGSMVAGKVAVTDLPPLTVGFIRFTLTAVVFILYFFWREKGSFLPIRTDWPIIVLLGLVGVFGANAAFLIGVRYSTAINGGLMNAGAPIVITVLSALFLREQIMPRQLFGILLSLFGVVVVIVKGSWTILANLSFNIGDLILLLNPVFLGIYSVLAKKLMNRYSALSLSAYTSIIGMVAFFPFFVHDRTWTDPAVHVTLSGWISLGYLGFLGTTLGVLWWNKGIAVVGANQSGIYMNGVPVVAMILSILLLGEKMITAGIIGTIFVISGVYLNSKGAVER
jgi:drug/metabolite transporter (DMT)-like permease